MENNIAYILCFLLIPLLLAGLLGALLMWLFGRNKVKGDLSLEGEGALRSENDALRAKLRDAEGGVKTRDGEISGLKAKLAAGAAAATAVAAGGAALSASKSDDSDDDSTYALEWRNRYLAARVKYLEGRVAEAPKAKAAVKKVAAKKKPAVKKAAPKAKAKAAPKPKVLYTDGPTAGAPDDLKLIKGIGPKFEGDLNSKGIYYFRQIAAWKAKDVTMVEGVIDSIPGRIKRDEWVKQAGGLAKGAGKAAPKKRGPKAKPAKAAKAAPKAKKAKSDKPEKGSLDAYHADVLGYHKTANRYKVKAIVDHCGIALRSRDGSLVACTDQKEKDTVAKNWCIKKLGLSEEKAAETVEGVCKEMKAQRFKNRVTFYYLCAKNTRTLAKI